MLWADLNWSEKQTIDKLMMGWELAHCPGYPTPGFYLHKGDFGREDRLTRIRDDLFLSLREKKLLIGMDGESGDHRWSPTLLAQEIYRAIGSTPFNPSLKSGPVWDIALTPITQPPNPISDPGQSGAAPPIYNSEAPS